MLRRTSAVNKQYLPKMVETVIFIKMSPLQLALYRFFLNSEPVKRAMDGLGRSGVQGEDLQVIPP